MGFSVMDLTLTFIYFHPAFKNMGYRLRTLRHTRLICSRRAVEQDTSRNSQSVKKAKSYKEAQQILQKAVVVAGGKHSRLINKASFKKAQ